MGEKCGWALNKNELVVGPAVEEVHMLYVHMCMDCSDT